MGVLGEAHVLTWKINELRREEIHMVTLHCHSVVNFKTKHRYLMSHVELSYKNIKHKIEKSLFNNYWRERSTRVVEGRSILVSDTSNKTCTLFTSPFYKYTKSTLCSTARNPLVEKDS